MIREVVAMCTCGCGASLVISPDASGNAEITYRPPTNAPCVPIGPLRHQYNALRLSANDARIIGAMMSVMVARND